MWGFSASVSHKSTDRHEEIETLVKTENQGLATEISESHANVISQSLAENERLSTTHNFGNDAASGAGVVWQFEYEIGHLFGTNVIGTRNLVLTDDTMEPPCCLPGTFLDNTNAHGPCLPDYPCVCSDFTCLSCPAGKFKSPVGNGSYISILMFGLRQGAIFSGSRCCIRIRLLRVRATTA